MRRVEHGHPEHPRPAHAHGARAPWILALVALSALWAWRLSSGAIVNVPVSPHQSTAEIARHLEAAGVVQFPRVFRVMAKLTGLDRRFKPGTYRLRAHMGGALALWKLAHSQPDLARIIVPEGFSARQIAERLQANGVTSESEFMDYVNANNLEGYLFPDTYDFIPGTPADAVAHRLHEEFDKRVAPEFAKHPPSKLSKAQVIILASIVQREATKPEERPMIAAVSLNRLQKRMRLEMDPTVQYALGGWKKGLTLQDLKVNSPYNTYLHYGLPPTPICSPGLDSIVAVLEPAQTTALYYVADNTGGHTFSSTYEEHLKAKYKAKRERRLRQIHAE